MAHYKLGANGQRELVHRTKAPQPQAPAQPKSAAVAKPPAAPVNAVSLPGSVPAVTTNTSTTSGGQ